MEVRRKRGCLDVLRVVLDGAAPATSDDVVRVIASPACPSETVEVGVQRESLRKLGHSAAQFNWPSVAEFVAGSLTRLLEANKNTHVAAKLTQLPDMPRARCDPTTDLALSFHLSR